MYGVKIIKTGSYLPPKILTNADLEKIVDTSDEWITTRTGIKERRIAEKDVCASDLAIFACKKIFEETSIEIEEIDTVIVATITPDNFFPSTACNIQKNLQLKNAACFDISAACSGFIYGLAVAKSLLESGNSKTVLLIGTEVMSKIINWKDRNTCVLFGDGAGAMLLTRTQPEDTNILSVYIKSDGNYGDLLKIPAGGSKMPTTLQTLNNNLHYIQMNGRETFKLAVTKMIEAVNKGLEMCNKKISDISLLIPHQANLRIINAIVERLEIPKEKVFINLDKYGNISSATTIIGLDEAIHQGRVKKGDLVELIAFGAGMTWGSAVIKL